MPAKFLVIRVALTAILVRDVPDQQGGMILVALGKLAVDERRLLTING